MTIKNFQGQDKSYAIAQPGKATIKHAQSNFDGGRATKKAGGNASKPQVNFEGAASIEVKTKTSHFGEKTLTGNNNGY